MFLALYDLFEMLIPMLYWSGIDLSLWVLCLKILYEKQNQFIDKSPVKNIKWPGKKKKASEYQKQ